MTNKEAIEVMQNWLDCVITREDRWTEALELGIKALEKQEPEKEIPEENKYF